MLLRVPSRSTLKRGGIWDAPTAEWKGNEQRCPNPWALIPPGEAGLGKPREHTLALTLHPGVVNLLSERSVLCCPPSPWLMLWLIFPLVLLPLLSCPAQPPSGAQGTPPLDFVSSTGSPVHRAGTLGPRGLTRTQSEESAHRWREGARLRFPRSYLLHCPPGSRAQALPSPGPYSRTLGHTGSSEDTAGSGSWSQGSGGMREGEDTAGSGSWSQGSGGMREGRGMLRRPSAPQGLPGTWLDLS